jgi:5-methylcytosine-specific restriction endonuclease McrA
VVRAELATYRAAHPERIREGKARRRALAKGASVGDRAAMQGIYREARTSKKVRCYLHGGLIPLGERHVDHVIPLAKGGRHAASNLAIACASCNCRKGTKLPQELGLLL